MKAVVWHGVGDVRVDNVPDPTIEDAGDIILKVTATAICGSDLHLFDGYIPAMKSGDILGHEFMGEVVETGASVSRLKKGDKVVVPFVIACGECWFCKKELWSACDTTNPDAPALRALYGFAGAGAGLFGYSHLYGGYAGGQAEYVRVPKADVGPIKVPAGLRDDQVLFLSDIFPTGYMAAENANIQPGDTVAVWGCGPVGQMAIKSAWMLGAGRVIAIDFVKERLEMARTLGQAEVIDHSNEDQQERLKEMTGGRGPDSVIDAVGMEAHGMGTVSAVVDRAKAAIGVGTDRPTALREAILACRKGGTVSVPGVYGGYLDSMPFGAAFGKGLTFKMGQTHAQKYLRPLMQKIEQGEVDPSFVITHRLKLDEAPGAYKTFRNKKDNCIKVFLTP